MNIGHPKHGADEDEVALHGIEHEKKTQERASWEKRKTVIVYIAVLTSIFIVLVQLSSFIHPILGIIEKYWAWEKQDAAKKLLHAIEAMSIWLGVFHSSDPQYNSYFYDIMGFVIILYWSVLEFRCTDWAERTMGYKFIKIEEQEEVKKLEEKKEEQKEVPSKDAKKIEEPGNKEKQKEKEPEKEESKKKSQESFAEIQAARFEKARIWARIFTIGKK